MRATFFFLGLALVIVVGVVLLVRSRKISEKYAVLWLIVGLVAIVLAAYPPLLDKLSSLVGVYTPSNLLFALAILLLVSVCMHLSLEVARMEDRVRRLAEEAAILRHQLEDGPPSARDRLGPSSNTEAAPSAATNPSSDDHPPVSPHDDPSSAQDTTDE